MKREKILLENGMTVFYVGHSKDTSVCLGVNVGHVNEPKLGIANLFERTLLLQVKGVIPVFGGTMTAYTAGGPDYETALEKVSRVFNQTVITEEYVKQAQALITKQTYDTAALPMRLMKLGYKHTAFGAHLVVSTEEYLQAVNSYTAEDVREFANTYYVGKNVFLTVAGPSEPLRELKDNATALFAGVVPGLPQPKFTANLYTGGGTFIAVNDDMTRLMFGWDVGHLSISDSPAVNVMMSMFLRRLERAYSEAGMSDVAVDLKIAGYYGLRTMRVYVASPTIDAKALTDVFVDVVERLVNTEASDERMEKSRSAAMVEKLDKYEKSDDAALEATWQLIGRGDMYNISSRINSIWGVTAHDVKVVARDILKGSRLTYVAADKDENAVYSYAEVMTALGLEDKL